MRRIVARVKQVSGAEWLVLAILFIASAARLLALNADPYFSDWLGYITDEGRWVETARNVVLFGDLDLYALSRLHLALSPGFQAVSFAVFAVAGVDFWTARMFPALSGIGILLLVAYGFRHAVHPLTLAFGLLFLGFESQFLFLSRIAVPEMPSLLFALVAFVLIVSPGFSWRRAMAAGLFAAASVAMKGTAVLTVPAFALMVVIEPTGATGETRMQKAGAFAAGFLAPIAGGILVASGLQVIDLGRTGATGDAMFRFLEFGNLAGLATRLREGSFLLPTCALLLASWLGPYAFVSSKVGCAFTRRVYVFSAVWAGWWAVVWMPMHYLPERYVVHLELPLALHAMAALTLVSRVGVGSLVEHLGAKPLATPGTRRLVAADAAWLSAPTALLLAPLMAWAVGEAGPTRISVAASAFAISWGLLGLATAMLRHRPAIVRSLCAFPAATIAAWLAACAALDHSPIFWADHSGLDAAFLGALAAGATCALVFGASARAPWHALGGAAATLVLVYFSATSLPHVLMPRYSILAESRRIDAQLAGARSVYVSRSASLLIPSRLRARSQLDPDNPDDAAVLFLPPSRVPRFTMPVPLEDFQRVDDRDLEVRWSPPDAGWSAARVIVLAKAGARR